MNKKSIFHLISRLGITFLCILMSFIQLDSSQAMQATPTPTLAPTQLVKTDPVLLPLKAPWPAGVTLHVGDPGYFYGGGGHVNGTYTRDAFALDINGETSKKDTISDSGVLVLAVADGMVNKVIYSKETYDSKGNIICNYGWNVVIGHPGGYLSRYAHLSNEPLVDEGEWIAQGTPLGYIGESGCYKGDHLHFAMYYCDPTLSQTECDLPQNKYAVKPEPLDNQSNLDDKDQITSSNYGVGYEEYVAQTDEKNKEEDLNKIHHDSFTDTYRILGGEATIFGPSISPVKKYQNTNFFYQEFGEFKYNAYSIWYGLNSVLFENDNSTYLIAGQIWETYDSQGGPNSALGLPVSQTYFWQERYGGGIDEGLRCDFQNGSIIWLKQKGIKILNSTNAPWRVNFYRLPNFTDLAFTRMDEHINLNWYPLPMSAILPQNMSGISSMMATATVDVGLVSIYKIRAEFQGNIEVLSDGVVVIPASTAEDNVQELTSTNIKSGKTDLEVRFWQTPFKEANIKISAEGLNLGIIPKVYAAEDFSARMDGLIENPKIEYSDFDPPPYDDSSYMSTPTNLFKGVSDSVLVFDTSGSMAEIDASGVAKIEAARKAGTQILNVIAAENSALNSANQVGIVSYSTTAEVVAPLSSDMNSIISTLNNLYPTEMTAMPDGLRMGIDLFGTSQGKKVLILLSDGLPNIGLNTDQSGDIGLIKQQALDLSREAGQNGICVYTVGFGDPAAGLGSIDEIFLQEVASASGCGQYYNARNAIDLANIYVELRHTSTGNVIFNQSGQIDQGQDIDLGTVAVAPNQETMLFTLNWPGSRLQPTLIDPVGVTVDQSYPGASISTTSSLVSIIVNNPQVGDWKLRIFGAEVPEGRTDYKAIISTRLGVVIPTIAPTASPSPSPSSGAPLALVTIVIAGGLVGVYAYSRSLKRRNIIPVGPIGKTPARLRGISGAISGRVIDLRDGDTIGRGVKNTIYLNDPAVSRSHAVLRYGNAAWYIQDLNSSGGIFVNGERVSAIRLNHGDQVKIGNQVFLFETN